MLSAPDLLVVGAGPAGIAAAIRASRLGLDVVVVEESAQAGGQYYRQTPGGLRIQRPTDGREARGAALIARLADVAELRLRTAAWGLDGGRVWTQVGAVSEAIHPGAVILATGSFDRPVAFPGWTLPGVVTAGGAQAMAKGQRVRPGSRALVAGTGPLSLVLAAHLAHAGVKVVELVEAASARQIVGCSPRLVAYPARWRELPGLLLALGRAGVRVALGSVVDAAEGGERVERARIVGVGRDGRPDLASRRWVDVDLLCTGYGFSAHTGLARVAGCSLAWDAGFGQPVPRHDQWQETSVPGTFVAGEATGFGGVHVAEAEGELAAVGAARRLGRLPERGADALAGPLRRRLRYWRGFATHLAAGFPVPGVLGHLVTDETLVCRCESVPFGHVRHSVDEGARALDELKLDTRCGLGLCQGRICGAVLPALLADRSAGLFDRQSQFTARPPVTPVSIGGLLPTLGQAEVRDGSRRELAADRQ